MVSTVSWSEVSARVPPPGTGSQPTTAPLQTRIAPAPIWPTSLVSAPSPQRSSTTPISTTTPPASSSPLPTRVPANTPLSGNIREATSSAAARPQYIASPPSSGDGLGVHVPLPGLVLGPEPG